MKSDELAPERDGIAVKVTRDRIARGISDLGISDGDSVFIHSSLSSMGHVVDGPDAVVAAFLDVLGPTGTLMVPTFSFSSTRVYDVRTTPSKTGAITEAVRRHPLSVRSPHPTHGSCAIGPDVDELMRDHLLFGPLDIGCPEDRLAKRGGWVLLLGVDHRVNSTVHIGEAYAGSIARRVRFNTISPARPRVIMPDGTELVVTIVSMPGCSEGFGAVEEPMRAEGQIIDGQIGAARCQLMKGQDVIDTTVQMLHSDPLALQCEFPNCPTCGPVRLKVLSEKNPCIHE